ncbi:uncharacterized protein Tco025E_03409, partial [Trypanosoma conorhini]
RPSSVGVHVCSNNFGAGRRHSGCVPSRLFLASAWGFPPGCLRVRQFPLQQQHAMGGGGQGPRVGQQKGPALCPCGGGGGTCGLQRTVTVKGREGDGGGRSAGVRRR